MYNKTYLHNHSKLLPQLSYDQAIYYEGHHVICLHNLIKTNKDAGGHSLYK